MLVTRNDNNNNNEFCIALVPSLSLLGGSSIQLGGIVTFCPLGYFGFEGIETFWAQKLRQDKLLQFTKILNYNKSSYIIFGAKLF